jgi:hypothetical protein
MVLPEQESFSVRNDAAGWAELVARLRGSRSRRSGSRRAEDTCAVALLAAGQTACQVNPVQTLRQFARASGVLAKNDPLDTRMIASPIMNGLELQFDALRRPTTELTVRLRIHTEPAEDATVPRLPKSNMVSIVVPQN